jgi:predicted short-subunit dehydrogenase-like oxidoreductase (DUF2520 family)
MELSIIGAGNVATVLGKALHQKNYSIREVYSRTHTRAALLADSLGAKAITELADLDGSSDLYLLAVPDTAIPELANRLQLGDRLLVHTAGSVSQNVLAVASSRFGVLWPMKMIRTSMPELGNVTMVMDGNSAETLSIIQDIAFALSPTVTRADDQMRSKMHLMAAFTANFSNHLYHLAANYCEAEKMDFNLFYSIIEETALGIRERHPRDNQAGPAFRGDQETLQKQMGMLTDYPQIQRMYQLMSESIGQTFRGG